MWHTAFGDISKNSFRRGKEMIKTSMVLGLSLAILWGGASHGMPSLEVLDDDALGHVMEKTSDADLLPLRLVSKRVGAAATAELIRRGSHTFSMKTMTAADLPHLVTFLKARKTARTLTISDFRVGLFCQALMALRAEAHDFSFGSLQSLVVKGGYIPMADLNRFLDLLEMMPNLTALGLKDGKIGNAGAQAVAGSSHLTRLTSLDLEDNMIGAAGAQAIAGSPHLARLTSLNLGYNGEIGDAGAQAIAGSTNMQHLTSLNLVGNTIHAAGVQAIAGSRHLARLTHLDLSINFIGAAGAQAIAESRHLRHLTSLNLEENSIGDPGAQAIAASANMGHLTSLNLKHTRGGDAGAQAIAASANMQHLTSLNLGGNFIGAAGAQAIAGSPHLVHLGPSRGVYVWG